MIDRSNLDHIKVHAGSMIKYDARMTGEPKPSKTWFINKKRQENGVDGVKLDEEDHRLKLIIQVSNRSHNGQYQIKASNSAGSDEVTLDVTVLGRSSVILLLPFFHIQYFQSILN